MSKRAWIAVLRAATTLRWVNIKYFIYRRRWQAGWAGQKPERVSGRPAFP